MSSQLNTFRLKEPEIKLWLIAFAILSIIYLPLLGNFIWGNHDWQPLITDSGLSAGLIEGRFAQYIFLNTFLMGKILPILNMLLGFLFYTLAIVLLYTRFFAFEIQKSTPIIIITATILPYINEILYFQFIVMSQLTWPLIIAFALLSAQKATQSEHLVFFTILTFLFLFLALGGYPASVNLFVTGACLKLVQKVTENTSLKNLTKQALPYFIPLCISFVLVYVIYQYLQHHRIMLNLYNNQHLSLSDLILKILPTIKLSLMSLIQPQPFFSLSYKILTTIIIVGFVCLEVCKTKNIKQRILICLLLFLLLLCLKFSAWLTNDIKGDFFADNDPSAFMVRTDFYAVPCLILYAITTLTKHKQLIKNITLLLTVTILWLSINADFSFSKTHLLGFKAETNLQQRINARLLEHENYNPETYYTVVQAGELPLRHKYYLRKPLEKYGLYTLNTPYTRHWIAFEYYNFYEPFPFVREGTFIDPADITPQMADFLSHIKTWPDAQSVYMDNNYAIMALTPDGKKLLTKQFGNIKKDLQ